MLFNKRLVFIIIGVLILLLVGGFYLFSQKSNNKTKEGKLDIKRSSTMIIKSKAFENNEKIPAKYTCDGENINPPLEIEGMPQEAQSLVLISDDPDAPAGTWVHWLVWNIDPTTKKIEENSVPSGASEGITSFGRPGYGGPCPPSGTHHYYFKVYALDSKLDLSPAGNIDDLERAMDGHILDKAEIVGLYSRD